jgi:putative DNA primase/helicase
MRLTATSCDLSVVAHVNGRAKADVVVLRRESEEPLATASYALADQAGQHGLLARMESEALQAQLAPLLLELAAQSVIQADEAREKRSDGQGSELTFPDPELWHEQVDGVAVLDEIRDHLRRFIILPEGAVEAIALWVVHTYSTKAAGVFPILAVISPDKRCGKSRLLSVLGALVYRPLPAANVSPAAIYRVIELFHPTFLLDEADAWFPEKEELRGLLNAGYERGQSVIRIVGEDQEPRSFRVDGPKAIAAIGKLPDTVQDRSVVVRMRRRTASESIEAWRINQKVEIEPIRRRIVRWTQDVLQVLTAMDPQVPTGLGDRAADRWRELLKIADAAGGDWPRTARWAAVVLSSEGGEDDEMSPAIQLLADIADRFRETGGEKVSSHDLVESLNAREDRPWREYGRGKGISAHRVANMLNRFGVRPKKIWIGSTKGHAAQGYELTEFVDAFARYLPCGSEGPEGTNAELELSDTLERKVEGVPSSPETPLTADGTTDLPDLPAQRTEGEGFEPGDAFDGTDPQVHFFQEERAHFPYPGEDE